jgi:hypothetical protein
VSQPILDTKALTGAARPPSGTIEIPSSPEPFAVPGFTGSIFSRYRLPGEAFARELAQVTDAASALKTLHAGRNYLYLARLTTPEGPVDVVVKQFRHTGWRDRLRRRSKAGRSFEVAQALLRAGLSTPEPVLLAESTDPAGPSFYICRYLPRAIEARYLFRSANSGDPEELGEKFPEVDFPAFVESLGRTVRRLHDAGFWHRDLSGGNVLLPADQAGAPRDLYLLDLNRTRIARAGQGLTLSQRSRDLCRLALFRPEDRSRLLAAYWAGEVGALRRGFYLLYHQSFLWKNRVKSAFRGLSPRLRNLVGPSRRPHAHIPPPPTGATMRDRVVWDALSDQPHQHAGRLEKLGIRLADARSHVEEGMAVAEALPRIWRRYRQIRADLHTRPVPWGGVGVAVRPHPEAPEVVPAALADLGAAPVPVLLRLHPWETDHAAAEELARELAARGHELTFALPQNRALVKDPARWRGAIEEIAERFSPYGRRFEIGHAINRSKWGVWNLGEYVDLALVATEILRRQPPRPGLGEVEILGPAVIDFEHHVTAAVLNLKRPGLHFDAVSSLLYVDRRGAPENRQAGFDTVAKVVLLKAIAETSRNATGRCFITEVNWPLSEGPHSPAGHAVSVSEEAQADYLARYYLLTLGTGLVKRVFWWQLIAKGYGLMDPENPRRPRRRPSFHALKTLNHELQGTSLERVLPTAEPARLYLFRRPDGMAVVAGWSAKGAASVLLPRSPAGVSSDHGESLTLPAGPRVTVGPSVRYFALLS